MCQKTLFILQMLKFFRLHIQPVQVKSSAGEHLLSGSGRKGQLRGSRRYLRGPRLFDFCPLPKHKNSIGVL